VNASGLPDSRRAQRIDYARIFGERSETADTFGGALEGRWGAFAPKNSGDGTIHGAVTVGRPDRIRWLPPLVFALNAAVLGLFMAYSFLNLRPDMAHVVPWETFRRWIVLPMALAVLAPTAASVVFVRPILTWVRRRRRDPDGAPGDVPVPIAERAADTPLALAAFSLLAWLLVTVVAFVRFRTNVPAIPLGLGVHMIVRPVLAGFFAGTATFFAADYVCRVHVWPTVLVGTRIVGNARLRRVRVSHRLLAFWLAISVVPLGVVTLTTSLQVAGLDLVLHAPIARVAAVVLLTAISAAVGGAGLAWLVSRSVGWPRRPWRACATVTSRRGSR
jgi:hypothetical protein